MSATQEQIEMVKAVVAKRRCTPQPWHADYVTMLAALDALLREREELKRKWEEETSLETRNAQNRAESLQAKLAEAQREIERLAQCIRERDAARSAAVGDQRGHWCSAHGVYCAALSAKAELEAQLQAEREGAQSVLKRLGGTQHNYKELASRREAAEAQLTRLREWVSGELALIDKVAAHRAAMLLAEADKGGSDGR